ncbi:hypothetical protein KY304_00140 [Candidatus Woesearchaeota archaeon]|nr:hypothetical protein [Candidatus Woesearchaeota archaeon]MBW2978505.1 hypothetical protein [Candidatus Woesearchaeota archaeon]
MRLVEKSFQDLFPDKKFQYTGVVNYSGRFKGFNANAKLNRSTKTFTFNLSKKWRGVDESIKIGLIQGLILRLLRKKGRTISMDLYENFIKNVHIAVPKTKSHPILEESFNRINKLYFAGMIEKPNLILGKGSRTLGNYDYGADTISISRILLPYIDLLDYVMYHEVLHKKNKFKSKNGRSFHHTSRFRKQEKAYPNAKELELKLGRISSKKKKLFGLF